ncbi:rRNA methyltransferase [Streptomyces sp. ISL-11]|uniref:rRNA methyltransferase n=1 Tax=Streptomyces sp. ISL-11 TaxID=2819174 RepID=UPI001BEAA0AC|nr:rRNA methyltransferase [Streptomyces sp. ISL-11]MBT2382488.1 rRNA methyltransferase [Streptomyces sp. ISL-11]
MPYRYATDRVDNSDFACGFVLHSAPGFPAFPVRLAAEIFLRAVSHLPGDGPVTLWDPCCGSGYLATVLGLLERDRLRRVIASDVDADALGIARRNLSLLTPEGLAERERARRADSERFAKPAYAEAADAAGRFAGRLAESGGGLPWSAHRADVFDPRSLAPLVAETPVDLVLTDIPYGERTHWAGDVRDEPIPAMLRSLASVLPPHAVVAVANRARKIPVGPVRPLERLKIGTRSVALVRAADLQDGGRP